MMPTGSYRPCETHAIGSQPGDLRSSLLCTGLSPSTMIFDGRDDADLNFFINPHPYPEISTFATRLPMN